MSAGADSALLMDRMYRWQRFIYDPTRKYYLFGRDRLIDRLDVPRGGSVLEVGCGTARNLVRCARRYPHARLFGLDASEEMLKSARISCRRAGIDGRIALARADATDFDPHALYGHVEGFDRILIAYALSMIPTWRAVVDHCLDVLAPGGSLHVVDFGRMDGMPPPARALMRRWLSWFHVQPRPELIEHMQSRAAHTGGTLRADSILGGYTQLATLVSAGNSLCRA